MAFGTLGIILGTAVAAAASRYPAQRARMEQWAGALILAGLALVGLAFPLI